MSPSAKKRPKNSVVFKMQEEKLQDNIQQPVHKLIEWNQLKMVLKNLSFLRLFKSSNPRIQELHNLAKRCWNSPLKVRKVLLISRNNAVCYKVDQDTEELQEASCSKKKRESKMLESIKKPKESEPKVGRRERRKVRQSHSAVPGREQAEPEAPKTSRDHRLTTCPGAWERQMPTGDHRVVFLKTHDGDMEQLAVADQWIWFEGLPTRIHLPGPRVMCRSSTLRWVKRCCTRFCSASLELPMCHPYRV
ncbi:TP53-target gene 5 protein [Pteronotus mesoamericanus]|uniref:TP53-target gene 5 protein n=1 Tax=Pteronotus mesoamericanus TaxID=1884717 RepID=UPI0023EC8BE8|nr:TP53-target gene 5 protein [Pteronotus parnellii mesoamericanus]